MANHTVPSINHRTISEGAIPEGAIPLERLVTSDVPDYGVEIAMLYSNRTTPANWGGVYATMALHADGSYCNPANCGCVPKSRATTIRDGQAVSVGGWVWRFHLSGVVVGWHRTGPSETEQRLQDRIERLDADLDHEAGHRHLAKEDLTALNVRAERLRALIRGLRADYRDMDRLAARLSCVAVAGWAVAALLALIMVAS